MDCFQRGYLYPVRDVRPVGVSRHPHFCSRGATRVLKNPVVTWGELDSGDRGNPQLCANRRTQ